MSIFTSKSYTEMSAASGHLRTFTLVIIGSISMFHNFVRISVLCLSSLLLLCESANAEDRNSQFKANSNSIFKVGSDGRRVQLFRATKGQSLADSTLSISPNNKWALIDFVPSNPGPGRVQEIRMLVSLETGKALHSEAFNSKYQAWLGELAEWVRDKPSTIVLDDEKTIIIR